MIRVLLFGSRYWHDPEPPTIVIRALIARFDYKLLVIEGKAPGADMLCGDLAREHGLHVAEVGALWDSLGRAAGPVRNGVMASLGPHLGVGFHADFKHSSGTADMYRKLGRLKVPRLIVPNEHTAHKFYRRLSR